jgi:hypothetical protein
MKRTLLLYVFTLLSLSVFSQTNIPQGVNYQAIARNAQGAVFVNQNLSVRASILSGSSIGPVQYQETHETTTNTFGLFNLKLGSGTPVEGLFSNIPWSEANQFLKVEIAFSGQPFTEIGNSELLSVPYSFYSQSSGTGGQPGQDGNTILNGVNDPTPEVGNAGDFYINTTTNQIFGPSSGDGWGQGTSLIGPAGPQGPPGTGGGGSGWALDGNAGTNSSQNYIGTSDNQSLRISSNATERLNIGADGKIRMIGDFVNQELKGNAITVGSPAIVDPPATPLNGPGTASAATLWLENNSVWCAVCTQPYSQSLPIFSGQAEVIDYPLQSITIEDGAGINNSGVLFMANISIKSTNNATDFGLANRYSLWVQRSTTADFSSGVTNVYRVEDAISSGINNLMNPPVLSSGISNTSIIYPDLNLTPGTYYYRLVYQNINGSTILQQNIFAQDRSIVLMQIKR